MEPTAASFIGWKTGHHVADELCGAASRFFSVRTARESVDLEGL